MEEHVSRGLCGSMTRGFGRCKVGSVEWGRCQADWGHYPTTRVMKEGSRSINAGSSLLGEGPRERETA